MKGVKQFRRRLASAVALAAAGVACGQCPGEKVASSRPWERASFGSTVQIKGDVAVVGDSSDQTFCTHPCNSGAVHTFRRTVAGWEHEAVLFHSRISGRDGFGVAVSMDGPDRFAASAPGEDVVEPDTGAVYIFEHNGETWREVAEIVPVEPQWTRGFGDTLLLRGDTLIVGEPRFQTAAAEPGAAWVYRLVGGRWEFAQKLVPPDPRTGARFSDAMAMDGEWLVVGARLDDEGGYHAGAAYIYRRPPEEGQFEFVRKLLAPGDPWNQLYGASVAIDGGLLAVGASNGVGGSGEGAVYIYSLTGDEWAHTATLLHDDPTEWNDALGASVDLSGDVVVAGAPRHVVPGLATGVAYAFYRHADGTWRQAAKMLPSGPSVDFGRAIATDGASVIVGAPYESAGGVASAGAAHIFDLACLLCRADLDGDGELTFFDFLAFQNLFAAGDLRADFDGDGVLTFFDFLAFQNEFAAGCD
jgi:hypothetical protein